MTETEKRLLDAAVAETRAEEGWQTDLRFVANRRAATAALLKARGQR